MYKGCAVLLSYSPLSCHLSLFQLHKNWNHKKMVMEPSGRLPMLLQTFSLGALSKLTQGRRLALQTRWQELSQSCFGWQRHVQNCLSHSLPCSLPAPSSFLIPSLLSEECLLKTHLCPASLLSLMCTKFPLFWIWKWLSDLLDSLKWLSVSFSFVSPT